MKVEVHHRDNCRLCHSKNVKMVTSLAPIPIAEKYGDSKEDAKAEMYPIDLYMCLDCGHVQCLDVIHSDVLWSDYTYRSAQTKGIVDHFKEVCDKVVAAYNPPPGSLIIDIGSNDGSLLRPFKDRGYRVLGIDPATEIAKKATASGIETIPELMTVDLAKQIRQKHGPAAVVTAFNVFAHADDMWGMADSVRAMIADDGVFVFEAQYLLDIIDKMLLGTIFHEHMSHHSLRPMSLFLNQHGLEMIEVERVNIQKGSIIGIAQPKGGPRKAKPTVAQLLALEESRHLDKPDAMRPFVDRLERNKKIAADLIAQWKKQGAVVAGFGAARSGPTLIEQFGFGDAIQYIFDDHPQKVNKYSPGHGYRVHPSRELTTLKPDYVIILAWIHAKKIIESNQEYLKQGGHFVVCAPDIQVVGAGSKVEIL